MRRDPGATQPRLTRRALLAAGAAVLAGCARQAGEPVPLLVGADTCAFCRMTILDDRLAAEHLMGGRVFKFDDVGCLRDWVLEHDAARSGQAFLRDHAGSGWVRAEAAVLVAGAVPTPMSTNVVAFRSEEDAAALVRARGGARIDRAELFGPGAARGRRYDMAARAAGGGKGGHRDE